MEQDGFKLVSRKKCTKLKKLKALPTDSQNIEELPLEYCIAKINQFVELLKSETLIQSFVNKLLAYKEDKDQNFDCSSQISLIVCYGLGRVTTCRIAQIQLAFLILLKEGIKVRVEAFDPLFSSNDEKILHMLGIIPISENERAKRVVPDNSRTLFYMPHCDLFLYNNLLSVNWNQIKLSNILVIGNSFKSIIVDRISSTINTKYKYVAMVSDMCLEFPFPAIKSMWDVFNNMALITFNITNVKNEIWNFQLKPCYSDDEN